MLKNWRLLVDWRDITSSHANDNEDKDLFGANFSPWTRLGTFLGLTPSDSISLASRASTPDSNMGAHGISSMPGTVVKTNSDTPRT